MSELPLTCQKINELYKTITKRDRSESEYCWEWMDTWNGQGKIYLKFDGDRLICHYGLIPVPFSVYGESVLAGKTENCMCHPNYKGKGIYFQHEKSRFEVAKKHFQMFFTTAGNVVPAGIIRAKLGYLAFDAWVTYYYFNPFIFTKNMLGVKLYDESNSPLREIAELWNKNKHRHWVSVDRNVKYMDWRINKNPYHKHKYLTLINRRELIGYCIFYFRSKHHIKIVDILADNLDPVIFDQLLYYTKRISGVRVVSFSTLKSNATLKDVFKSSHFIGRYQKNNDFYVYMPDWTNLNPQDWYITDLVKEGR